MADTPLRKARLKLDLTLDAVADAVGIAKSALCRYEKQVRIPPVETAEDIVRFYRSHGVRDLTEMHVLYPERFTRSEVGAKR